MKRGLVDSIDLKRVDRRFKSVAIYRLRNFKGILRKEFKMVSIGAWRKYMLGSRSAAKIVGFTPDYIGFRPGRPVIHTNYIVEYLKHYSFDYIYRKFPNLYNSLIKVLSEYRDVWTGAPDTNMTHLKSYFDANQPNQPSCEDILNICGKSNWFQIPHLDFKDIREMIYMPNVNPRAHNGHYTSKVLQCGEKGYSIVGAVRLAIQKVNLAMRVPIKNYCLWDVFAREKDSKIDPSDKNKDYSTRVVVNPEHHISHLCSWFTQKIMMSYYGSGLSKTKWMLDGEYNGNKAAKIRNHFSKYDLVLDADWSSFDTSIDTNFLICVGLLVFSNSIHTKEDLRLAFFFMSTFINKYIAIPPGIVVECNRGNPSGHPGVTLINCFVNVMRWAIIGYEIYGDNYQDFMDVHVYGDDAIIGFTDTPKLYEIDNICNKYGWKADPMIDKLYPGKYFGLFLDQGPDFLKRRLGPYGLHWNREKLFQKIIYQSRKRDSLDQISLLKGFIETAPGDPDMNNLLTDIIKYICDRNNVDFNDHIPQIDETRFLGFEYNDVLEGYYQEKQILGTSEEIYLKRNVQEAVELDNNWDVISFMTDSPHLIHHYRYLFRIGWATSENKTLPLLFKWTSFNKNYLNQVVKKYTYFDNTT